MKINDKTKPADAGRAEAAAIIKTVNLFYNDDHALQYLDSLANGIGREFSRRIEAKRVQEIVRKARKDRKL